MLNGMRPAVPPVTLRQLETLSVIARLTRQYGYAPVNTEIAEALDPPCSWQAVQQMLGTLSGKGLVAFQMGVHRSLRLTDEGSKHLRSTQLQADPED